MKLNRHLLRCHPGRKDQRLVHNKVVAEEEEVAMNPHMEGEEVMTMGVIAMVVMTEEEEEAMTHRMEDEEVMIEEVMIKEAMIEEGEEDVVVMIMVAEEVEEETNSKEGGQTVEVVATRMATTGIATTEMQVFKRVATMVVVVAAATKEEAMVATSHLHTQEVATKGVVATSKTTDTKKVGNLSNISSTEAISIINLVLDKEDISRAEAAKNFCFSRAQIIKTWFQSPGLITFELVQVCTNVRQNLLGWVLCVELSTAFCRLSSPSPPGLSELNAS